MSRAAKSLDKSKMLKPSELKKLLAIFAFIRPHRWHFFGALVLLVLGSVLFMAFPGLAGELLNVAQGKPRFGLSINDIGLLFVFILITQAVFSYIRTYLFAVVSERGMADARRKLYAKLIGQHIEFYESRRVGELSSRITADIAQMQSVISITLAEFLRQLVTLIVGIFILFWLTPKLTLVMLLVLPISILLALIFGRYIKKLSRERQDQLAESNTIVDETLQAFSVVKSFSNEHYELNRYTKSLREIVSVSLKFAKVKGLFFAFLISVMTGSIFFILWKGALYVQDGVIASGDLLSFIFYSGLMAGAFASLANFYAVMSGAVGATERVIDLINSTPEIDVESSLTARDLPPVKGNLRLENVSFFYPTRPDVQVLNQISLEVKSGQKIALVGASGAGKSTTVSLLLRFYDDYSGNIFLDDRPISEYPLTEYRRYFGVIPQEVLLFGGTIRENIAYGNPNAGFEQIRQAARRANALDFILNFPDGFETLVGERGVKLSGGQRQRIAIARAILREPKILILDEATSALDAESERLVQEALNKLMEGRSSIIIAHRLSTIRDVDQIYVLDQGKIVEQGTHDELITNKDGVYYHLNILQVQAAQR